MDTMMQGVNSVQQLWSSIQTFESAPLIKLMKELDDTPIIAVGFYYIFVAAVPTILKLHPLPKWLPLHGLFTAWNLFLSVFSTLGAVSVIPEVAQYWYSNGFRDTMCEPWAFEGPVGFWLAAFCLSKIPELFDTILLVIRQKEVIFLHSYHHGSVLVFCYSSYMKKSSVGIVFCAMNYFVHSVMYAYFAAMQHPSTRKVVKGFAMTITTIQILQMVFGTMIMLYSIYVTHYLQESCHIAGTTQVLGTVMYMSYFGLFAALFHAKYFGSKKPASNVEKAPINSTTVVETTARTTQKGNDLRFREASKRSFPRTFAYSSFSFAQPKSELPTILTQPEGEVLLEKKGSIGIY